MGKPGSYLLLTAGCRYLTYISSSINVGDPHVNRMLKIVQTIIAAPPSLHYKVKAESISLICFCQIGDIMVGDSAQEKMILSKKKSSYRPNDTQVPKSTRLIAPPPS